MVLQGLATRLRMARAAANLTQFAVAQALGYTSTTVANWERSRTEPCSTDLTRLASLYRVSVDWLLTGSPRLPHRFDGCERCQHGIPISDRCEACEA
jgi:transcriptional regulator with XRE-family HTH domain